ncbi:MAG: Selenophosphate-dependent tRNA 2-selenouridine synthase [Firmicutes bacterium]|nr:Selenophosphate-dependent tRNA 2-selenouridine synthase [Bacillota bacterium]MDI6706899.1 tRNA 2-selenouridine(34) synthase MnmH [Bacillota bacterium]
MKVEDIKRDCIMIDVRSPGEYEDGTIPGAINIPIFDDEERAVIGTLYKKVGTREAKKRGIEIVSSKLSDIYSKVEQHDIKGRDMVLFCSKGGMRSGSLVQLLKALGHRVEQLEGGYKAYRRYILDNLGGLIRGKNVVVIHGNTGVGKTEILKRLEKEGFPSVDLEEMANSRGSIFGTVGLGKARGQRDFDALLYDRLRDIDADYIIVESESPRVGRVYLPNELVEGMKTGIHLLVECSEQTRITRIVNEYIKIQSSEALAEIQDSINRLEGEIGRKKTAELLGLLEEKKYREVVRILLEDHYDPKYRHSEKKYDYDLTLSSENIDDCVCRIMNYLRQNL